MKLKADVIYLRVLSETSGRRIRRLVHRAEPDTERVTGIGGVFFRAKDPTALAHWYSEHLGIENGLEGEVVWQQQAGPTVFAPFESDTDYFSSTKEPTQQAMLNFRVRDLDAMLAQLRAAAVDVDDETQTEHSVGRFGWATDPEGNRFELWEPISEGGYIDSGERILTEPLTPVPESAEKAEPGELRSRRE